MSYSEFENDYKTNESLVQLTELFDLFIINPAIIYKVSPKLIPYLRNRNKSCGILPMAYNLLRINHDKYSLKLAKLIAKYRDSTYYINFNLKHKFIKIGESLMNKKDLKDNLINVLNYGLCILPNGGINNVLRLSLHINNTHIQLPFYVNLDPLSYHYNIISNNNNDKIKSLSNSVFVKKRKQKKLKDCMKKNCPKKLKIALIKTVPITNLSSLRFVKQCNEQ